MFVNECDIVTYCRNCEVSPILLCSGITAYPETYNAKHVVLSTRSYEAFKFLLRIWLHMDPLSKVLAPKDLWVGTYNCNETVLDNERVYNKFIVCGTPDALSRLETFDTKYTIFYKHAIENEGETEEPEELEEPDDSGDSGNSEDSEDSEDSDVEPEIILMFIGHKVPTLNTTKQY